MGFMYSLLTTILLDIYRQQTGPSRKEKGGLGAVRGGGRGARPESCPPAGVESAPRGAGWWRSKKEKGGIFPFRGGGRGAAK